jgi:hypothetical protein
MSVIGYFLIQISIKLLHIKYGGDNVKEEMMIGKMKEMMMMEKMMKKKMMTKEIMEMLSDDDKRKLLAMKLDLKIDMMEQKREMMEHKKKLMAAKLDMKSSMIKKKLEIMKAVKEMLK